MLLTAVVALLASIRWRALLLAGLFFVGAGWTVWNAQSALLAQLPVALEGQSLSIDGQIVGLADLTTRDGVRFRFQPDCMTLPAISCRDQSNWLFQLNSGSSLRLWPGERWRFTLKLRRPHGLASPGAFDSEAWLLEEGVTATGTVSGAAPLRAAEWSIDGYRMMLRETFHGLFPDQPEAAVQLALLTGDHALVPAPLWASYARAGISHLMAISGPHITLAALVAMFFLRRLLLRLPTVATRWSVPSICLLAGLGISVLYGFLAGLGIPTARTLLMLVVAVWAGWRRRVLPVSAIFLHSLLIVLVFQPLAPLAAGFWLSFVAVAILMLMAGRPQDESAWREFVRTQYVVTVGLLPLTILIFARISLVSPLCNAVAIPVVSLAIVPLGMLGLVGYTVWPPLGIACWKLGIWLIHWLNVGLLALATPTWSVMSVVLPPLALLSLTLAALCLILPRGMPGRWLAAVLLVPVFYARPALPEGAWRLAVLDVGEGESAVIQTRSHTLVFDAGPAQGAQFDAGTRVVVPYLQAQGLRQVDALMLADDNPGHTGGAGAVLAAFPATRLLGYAPRGGLDGAARSACLRGQDWNWDQVAFHVLYPLAGEGSACVLLVVGGGHRLLLSGNLTAQDEHLLQQSGRLDQGAEVIVAGREGSAAATSAAYLDWLHPQLALISTAYLSRYHHPSVKLLDRLQERHIPWKVTAADGTLKLDFLPGQPLKSRAWRDESGHFWGRPGRGAP